MQFDLIIPTSLNPNKVEVRVAGTPDAPLFCLADVCKVLEIENVGNVVNRLEEDDIRQADVIDTIGRMQKSTFVTEAGLYTVLLRSDKSQAKPFRKWVTGDVLPTIRKYGCYPAPAAKAKREPMSLLAIRDMLDKMIEHDEQLDALAERQDTLSADLAGTHALAQAALDCHQGNFGCYSALAFLKMHGLDATYSEASRLGFRATRICRERGVEVRKMRDPRFGEVNLYPESVLEKAWEFLNPAHQAVGSCSLFRQDRA